MTDLQRPPRRPTILEVAATAGVSKSTVSRVINGDTAVSLAAKDAVEHAIASLGYTPSFAARQLRRSSVRSVGLFSSAIDTPIFAALNMYLQEVLRPGGFHVVQETIVGRAPHVHREHLENLIRLGVEGLITAVGALSSELIAEYHRRLPLIVMGRPEANVAVHNIAFDEDGHGRLSIDHLYRLGHRRIIVQTKRPEESMGSFVRSTAAIRYAREHGMRVIAAPPQRIFTDPSWLAAQVRSGVTAALCAFDRWALDTWRAALAAGLRVPDDLSLVGADGMLDGIDLLGLTTIRKPVEVVARRTAEVMTGLLTQGAPAAPVRESHRGILLIGNTTAAVS